MKDLIGQRFGRLIVTGFSHKDKNHSVYWICECDCGTKNKIVSASCLRGKTKSCGCLHRELLRKSKNLNTYKFIDDYVIGYTIKNEKFYFDLEDYEKIIRDGNYWFIEDGYVRARRGMNNIRYRVSMNRLIMNARNTQHIDHINQQRSDNRKINLRIANKSQNAMNSKIPSNNGTGHKGVRWNKINNNWNAGIGFHGKTIYLGSYKNIEDAIASRLNAEEKYFKEFMPYKREEN